MKFFAYIALAVLGLIVVWNNPTNVFAYALLLPAVAMICTWADERV